MEQAGAPIAAVRDDCGPADGGLRTGKLPRLAQLFGLLVGLAITPWLARIPGFRRRTEEET